MKLKHLLVIVAASLATAIALVPLSASADATPSSAALPPPNCEEGL